jgi:hypothetical protein
MLPLHTSSVKKLLLSALKCVCGVCGVRQIEMHTAEPSYSEVQGAVEMLNDVNH